MPKPKGRLIGSGTGLAVLLLCGLAWVTCFVINPVARFQQYQAQAVLNHANRLDRIVGEVEPVFLAEDGWIFTHLSPDGQWLVVAKASQPYGSGEWGMMEVATSRIYPLDVPDGAGSVWIDNHHYMFPQAMVRVPEIKTWRIENLFLETDPNALAHLAGAGTVLALEGKVNGAYVVVSIDPERPYQVTVQADDKAALAAQLEGLPYSIVPVKVWYVWRDAYNARLYSPDGKYFVAGGEYTPEEDTYHPQLLTSREAMICTHGIKDRQCPGLIFETETESLVALAGKNGWAARVLGWGPDSSGVYLQFIPMGGGYGFAPAGFPTYKLLVPGQKPSGKKPSLVEDKSPGN